MITSKKQIFAKKQSLVLLSQRKLSRLRTLIKVHTSVKNMFQNNMSIYKSAWKLFQSQSHTLNDVFFFRFCYKKNNHSNKKTRNMPRWTLPIRTTAIGNCWAGIEYSTSATKMSLKIEVHFVHQQIKSYSPLFIALLLYSQLLPL